MTRTDAARADALRSGATPPRRDTGRAARREPLVLLPGLSCDAALWRPVVERLPGVDCRVDALPDHDDLRAIARDVLALAPPSFALAGHSMGGRVALEMLRLAPQRIARVALLDTGYAALPSGAAGESERRHRHDLLATARGEGMRAMGERWCVPMVHPARRADAALMTSIVAMVARSTPERFARQVAALLARPDAADVLAAIRCPALVLCGREDGWAPADRHREMASRVPGARLVIVDACGHMAPMERPDEVAAALAAWLGASPEPRAGPVTGSMSQSARSVP